MFLLNNLGELSIMPYLKYLTPFRDEIRKYRTPRNRFDFREKEFSPFVFDVESYRPLLHSLSTPIQYFAKFIIITTLILRRNRLVSTAVTNVLKLSTQAQLLLLFRK